MQLNSNFQVISSERKNINTHDVILNTGISCSSLSDKDSIKNQIFNKKEPILSHTSSVLCEMHRFCNKEKANQK